MNDKLVERFLANPYSIKMGAGKLARRWRCSEEAVRDARRRAKKLMEHNDEATIADYVAVLEDELVQKVDIDKGTLSSTATSDFEPKTDLELAALHHVDLLKYKISSYWTKLKSNGRFTSSLFCTLRKIESDPQMQIEVIENCLRESLLGIQVYSPLQHQGVIDKSRALVVVTSDEHVAAAGLEDDLYNTPYDKSQYLLRKLQVLNAIREQVAENGPFDEYLDIKLGDDLDGWNAGTTRSGEPGHMHNLPQNMNNKQAVETYIRVNNWFWDEIMKINPAISYRKIDVVNSNHGGNGLDYIANLGVQIYLEAKYPSISTEYIHKFIGHIEYGKHNIMLTHGKDEQYRKKPFPLNLDAQTEVMVKQYMDYHEFRPGCHNILLKGDLHQWNWNAGKFFDYINIGSLYGSSGWVQANFGLTAPSFAIGCLSKDSNDFSLRPVYLTPA